MHIDTSCKIHENKDTGIAYKIIGSNKHKGLALSKKFKRELKRRLEADKDYARIYSIAIYYLIKDEFESFGTLVICGDEKFSEVKRYLNLLFKEEANYQKKKVISLYRLRKTTGKNKLKSYADKVAGSYRKRGLKSLRKRQEGIYLNIFKINLKMIAEKIRELEK